jgi:hypothetical protein
LEALCRQHQLEANGIADGWIAAAVLARRECLVTLDRDFVLLLPVGLGSLGCWHHLCRCSAGSTTLQ